MGEISLKKLWVLMVTAFVDMLGYALVFPLLPLYAKQFGASPTVIGLLLASFALAQLVTAPLWGRLSDRVGRRPVILAGQALSAVAFAVFAAADSVWLLLLSRLAQGAGGGTISANQAYVSDAVKPEQRAQALGWITACTSAGVMIGPALGSLSLAWSGSDAAPGLIAAGLCVLNVAFAWRWLPESVGSGPVGSGPVGSGPEAREQDQPKRARPPLLASVAEVLSHPGRPAHTLIWIYASAMMAFMASASVIALYLSDRFAVPKEHIGYVYVAMGFVSVLMRGWIIGQLVRVLGEVRVLRMGALTLTAGLALTPLAPDLWLFLFFVLLMPLGTALLFPSTTSLISRHAEAGEAGQIHGVQQAFGGASRLLGPVWAGVVYELCEPSTGLACGGALPFWIGAGILTLTIFLSLKIRPSKRPKPGIPEPDPAEA